MFGSAVKLGDLNDYMGVNQDCIQPLLTKPSKKSKANLNSNSDKNFNTDSTTGGPDKIDINSTSSITKNTRGPLAIDAQRNIATASSSTNHNVDTRGNIIKQQVSEKSGEVVATVGLSDCLSCSGCVTSSEAVLLQNQSVGKLRKLLLMKGGGDEEEHSCKDHNHTSVNFNGSSNSGTGASKHQNDHDCGCHDYNKDPKVDSESDSKQADLIKLLDSADTDLKTKKDALAAAVEIMNSQTAAAKTEAEEKKELEQLKNHAIVVSISQESLVNLSLKFGSQDSSQTESNSNPESTTNLNRGTTSSLSLLQTAGRISTMFQILSCFQKEIYVMDTSVAWELYVREVLRELVGDREEIGGEEGSKEQEDDDDKENKKTDTNTTTVSKNDNENDEDDDQPSGPKVPTKTERKLAKLQTLLTSNCPGFAVYSEKIAPEEVVRHLSSVRNHLQIQGDLVKEYVGKGVEGWKKKFNVHDKSSSVNMLNFCSLNNFSSMLVPNSSDPLNEATKLQKMLNETSLSLKLYGNAYHNMNNLSNSLKKKKKIFHVSIVPCYDRKIEFAREEFKNVDLILATEELFELASILPKLEEIDISKQNQSQRVPGINVNATRNDAAVSNKTKNQTLPNNNFNLSNDLKSLDSRLQSLQSVQFLVDAEGRMTKPSSDQEHKIRDTFQRLEIGPFFSPTMDIENGNCLREVTGVYRQTPVSETLGRIVKMVNENKVNGTSVITVTDSRTSNGTLTTMINKILSKTLTPINAYSNIQSGLYDLLTSIYKPVRRDVYFAAVQNQNKLINKLPTSSENKTLSTLTGNLAIAYGFKHIQNVVRLIETQNKNQNLHGAKYSFIEVLACPGGCLNGGGQMKFENENTKEGEDDDDGKSESSKKNRKPQMSPLERMARVIHDVEPDMTKRVVDVDKTTSDTVRGFDDHSPESAWISTLRDVNQIMDQKDKLDSDSDEKFDPRKLNVLHRSFAANAQTILW